MVWISRAPNSKTNKSFKGFERRFWFLFQVIDSFGSYLPPPPNISMLYTLLQYLDSLEAEKMHILIVCCPALKEEIYVGWGEGVVRRILSYLARFFHIIFLFESLVVAWIVECGGHHIWNMFLGGHSMCATNSQALTFDKPTTKSSRKRIGFFCDSKGQAKNQVSAT